MFNLGTQAAQNVGAYLYTILGEGASAYTWLQRYGDALRAYRELFEGGNYDETDLRDLHGLARDRDADLALRAAVAVLEVVGR